MGRRDRLRKQAVIEGREPPFRASPEKPPATEPLSLKKVVAVHEASPVSHMCSACGEMITPGEENEVGDSQGGWKHADEELCEILQMKKRMRA